MNSLVLELQKDALDPSLPLLNVLRKAFVVASKLNLQELKDWTESELKGYFFQSKIEIPQYRIVSGELKAFNPHRGWIPVIVRDAEIRESLSERHIGQPISELEDLYNNAEDYLTVRFPVAAQLSLMEFFSTDFIFCTYISKATVHKIIESVRDTILNWSLKLEVDGILGEGMSFSPQEKELASNNNYGIGNFLNWGEITMSEFRKVDIDQSKASIGVGYNETINTAQLAGTIRNYAPEQKQMLAEALGEMQKLLKQQEQTNPTATEAQQIEHLNDETSPNFKRRFTSALQAFGETAIDEFVLENKWLKVIKETGKRWMKPE